MKPSVLLAKAKRIIETEGWCQGVYHKKGDGYCSYGAIAKASGASDDALSDTWYDGDVLTGLAVRHLEAVVPFSIDGWNDTKGRTKKQVLAAFDKAIKLAKLAGE